MPSLPEVSTTLCIVDSETAFAVPTLFPPFLAITSVAVLTKPSLTNAVACRGFTPVFNAWPSAALIVPWLMEAVNSRSL